MNSSVAGWLLCLTALVLWGSIGTLAKASGVQWSAFFKAYSVGVGASALVLAVANAADLRAITGGAAVYGVFAGLCGCGGSMCFLSSIEMVGVTLSYPVVMGIEMTWGTFLLYLLDRDALHVGPLLGALACVLGAVALDALAQLRLDADERCSIPEADGLLGSPALARGKSLGKLDFVPEGDDDELDFVFDGDDDACVPIERLAAALSPTKAREQRGDKPQSAQRGVRRAVAAGVLLSFWPAGEALAVDAGATVPAFMVVLGLSHLLFCIILVPIRTAYLRRPGSKVSPPSDVGICSLAWLCGVVAGAAWFCGAVLVFIAGEDIGVTVAVSVARCSPTVAALWGLFYWGEAEHASPRALAYIATMLCLYGAAILLIARSAA